MAYYEKQLSREMQAVYQTLLRGFQNMEPSIRVPMTDTRQLSEIYTRLRLDHPEIFYLTGFRIRAAQGAASGELLPDYLFEKNKILEHRQAILARTERLLRPVQQADPEEKIAFLHRFFCENVRYDKLKKSYSHEVIGPLTQGVGVCEGIAKAFKLLADALGIPCIVALSAPAEGKKYGHTWNLIQRNGKWYHLDATFDLSLSQCGELRWDYYLLGDTQIVRDHEKPVYPVPECPDHGSFGYLLQRLSFTKQEDLAKRTAQAIRKKRPRLVFHWRGGYLTRETVQQLAGVILQTAEQSGAFAELTLNWPQAVFCVHFLRQAPQSREILLEHTEEIEEEDSV